MATWNRSNKEWEFSLGEDAWFVVGHYNYDLLMVKVTILKVFSHRRKSYGDNGGLTYVIDEPIEDAIEADDLFPTKELAMTELNRRVRFANAKLLQPVKHPVTRKVTEPPPMGIENYKSKISLTKCRDCAVQAINNFRESYHGFTRLPIPYKFVPTRNKLKDIDWFLPTAVPKRYV
jgi:hypothetical protein